MLPLLASAGAKLLPYITKFAAGPLGSMLSRFAPTVASMLSQVTTKFPMVATLATRVSAFAAKNPIMTQIGSMFLPGQPITGLGAMALSNPAAMAAIKGAWMKGAGAVA